MERLACSTPCSTTMTPCNSVRCPCDLPVCAVSMSLAIKAAHTTGPHCSRTAGPGSFLQRFYLATADMNPEQRGKFLEEPPEGMRDIDDVHHVRPSAN